MRFIFCSLFFTSILFVAAVETKTQNAPRVVRMRETPEPENIHIHFIGPTPEKLESGKVKVQIQLEAYPLGIFSDFPRARQIRDSGEGQAMRIILDGNSPFDVNEAINEISESEEIDFDQTLVTAIPYSLSNGVHLLRVFPIRSFSESLKGPGCFAATIFFVNQRSNTPYFDLNMPYLTYNEPEGEYVAGQPILLDFYLSNIQLSPDGFKVRVTIDHKDKRILTDWAPYYIYNLSPGKHMVELELLDPDNKVVRPLFNDLKRNFTVR